MEMRDGETKSRKKERVETSSFGVIDMSESQLFTITLLKNIHIFTSYIFTIYNKMNG